MWTPLNSLWSNLVQISLPKPQVVQPKKKKKVLFFISFARIWTVSVLQRTKASVIQRIQKEPRYPIPSSNTSLPLLCPSCTRRSKWRCWNLSEPRKTRLRESLWRMAPGLQGRGIQTKRCATNKSDMTVSRELLQTMCPILESRLDLQTWPRTMFLHTAWISPRRKRWSWQHFAWLLSRIRCMTAFFRSRTKASYQLKQKKKEQLPRRRLVTDVVTRWNSSYDMVGRFLEQPAICAAILSSEVRKTE